MVPSALPAKIEEVDGSALITRESAKHQSAKHQMVVQSNIKASRTIALHALRAIGWSVHTAGAGEFLMEEGDVEDVLQASRTADCGLAWRGVYWVTPVE